MMSVRLLNHIRLDGRRWEPTDWDGFGLPKLAIVGSAPGWEYEAELIPDDYDVMAVNRVGFEMTWRDVKWWATLHPEIMRAWFPLREANGGETVATVVSPFNVSERFVPAPYSRRISLEPLGGSSSLYAILAALVLGYRSIELYGIKLDGGYEQFTKQWNLIEDILRKYVTAHCPGFPRELLGLT
jgi:hypothetical protein